jgi:hypothetical protein
MPLHSQIRWQTRINFLRPCDKPLREKELRSIIVLPLTKEQMTEAQLYKTVYQHVLSVAHPRQPYVQFNDRTIVLVYVWSVLHDRPVCWACDKRNWPKERIGELPSDSTMSLRLRTLSVQQLLERTLAAVADLFHVPLVKQIDSKPLIVGAYSKDPDAKRGRVAAGQMARGYRLNTLNHGRAVQHFELAPMNDHDSVTAPKLLKHLKGGGYVLGDNAFDTNALHQEAAANNHQLVAPARAVNKGVRDIKSNCPQRLRALDLLDSPLEKCGLKSEFGSNLYNRRTAIESGFGELSLMGMNYLPAWVRGPRRVAVWCAAKLLIYLCRLATKQGLMK